MIMIYLECSNVRCWIIKHKQFLVIFVHPCVLLLVLSCLVCNCCWLAVCIVVVVLCVCRYLMCICCTMWALLFFTLDAGLLARSQYSEGPATGHLDTGFSWFPCV